MGRRKNAIETTAITVRIPSDTCRQVKILLMDPKNGRTQYGTMAGLLTNLLNNWLEKQKEAARNEVNHDR
jgi:hypothetical protein